MLKVVYGIKSLPLQKSYRFDKINSARLQSLSLTMLYLIGEIANE